LKEEPVPVSQPAEPPATPSAQFEVRTVTLDDGQVEYDPRDGSAAIMVVDGIHGNLLLQSMSAGSYGLELSLVDEPILALALRAKLQVDERELDIEALSFKLDLAREQDHYLTPPVQKLLAARDITGRLSAEINGVVPLDDGGSSDLHVRFELIDASIAAGSYRWALNRADARLSATGRTMTIEEFSIDTMGGHATAGGSIELDVPFAAALHFEGKDLQIGDLLRAEELPGGAPSFEGLLTASGTLQCPLAEIGRHAGGEARVSLAKARLGRFPVLSTIDEALDAHAEKAMKREHTGHDSLSLELSLGGDRARIKNLRLNSRWYGLRGHGDVGFDSRLDFIAEGGPVQRLENEMGPLGDVLGELTETILRARFTGTLSAPEIGFEPIRQPLSR
jgi:hypothetical protein